LQIFTIGPCIIDGRDIQRRVAILLDRAPAFEPRIQQDLAHGREIDVALTKVAEDALAAGVVKARAFRDGLSFNNGIDILEMHV
jgi:hypothetical protein